MDFLYYLMGAATDMLILRNSIQQIFFWAPPKCLLCTNSEQTYKRTLSLEGSPSGGFDQPSEKNAKLFAFVGIFHIYQK